LAKNGTTFGHVSVRNLTFAQTVLKSMALSSLTHAKRSFNHSTNAIFGKIGRVASEEVTLQLINCKCRSMPILLYGLECFLVAKHDLRSLDFTVTRRLIQSFRSSNVNVIDECRMFFNFLLLSEKIEKRIT